MQPQSGANRRQAGNVFIKAMVLIGIAVAIGAVAAVLWPVVIQPRKPAGKLVTEPAKTQEPAPIPATEPETNGSDETDDGQTSEPAETIDPVEANPTADWPEHHVTVEDAHAAWSAGTAVLVDTRPHELFVQEHVDSAISLPYEDFHAGTPANLDYLLMDPSQQIILYCSGGDCHESDATATMLGNYGFTSVFVMHDGLPGWKNAGHPTATGDASP